MWTVGRALFIYRKVTAHWAFLRPRLCRRWALTAAVPVPIPGPDLGAASFAIREMLRGTLSLGKKLEKEHLGS